MALRVVWSGLDDDGSAVALPSFLDAGLLIYNDWRFGCILDYFIAELFSNSRSGTPAGRLDVRRGRARSATAVFSAIFNLERRRRTGMYVGDVHELVDFAGFVRGKVSIGASLRHDAHPA